MGMEVHAVRLPSGSCERFFTTEYTVDSIFPDVGPGFFERFPYHLLPFPAAIQEMITTPRSIVQDNQPQSSFQREANPRQFMTHLKEQVEIFTRSRPVWARVRIEFRHIQKFWSDSPVDSAELSAESSPITLLPREWQVRALTRVLEKPNLKYKYRFQYILRMATNSSFSLHGTGPRQSHPSRQEMERTGTEMDFLGNGPQFGWKEGYDGNLDPRSQADWLLRKLREHYFGDRTVISDAEYKAALRPHVVFTLR